MNLSQIGSTLHQFSETNERWSRGPATVASNIAVNAEAWAQDAQVLASPVHGMPQAAGSAYQQRRVATRPGALERVSEEGAMGIDYEGASPPKSQAQPQVSSLSNSAVGWDVECFSYNAAPTGPVGELPSAELLKHFDFEAGILRLKSYVLSRQNRFMRKFKAVSHRNLPRFRFG